MHFGWVLHTQIFNILQGLESKMRPLIESLKPDEKMGLANGT
jgi:hypothetical protein